MRTNLIKPKVKPEVKPEVRAEVSSDDGMLDMVIALYCKRGKER